MISLVYFSDEFVVMNFKQNEFFQKCSWNFFPRVPAKMTNS